MKALKTASLGRAEVQDTPIPSIQGHPGYVLVKNKYTGVNPSDYLFTDTDWIFVKGITVGSEFSGVVVEADAACKRFKPGDRIAGYAFPGNPTMPNGGCHAEYCLAKGDVMLRLDDIGGAIADEQAAGICVAVATAFIGLYRFLGLPLPGAQTQVEKAPILIYGGSSATGMMAVQFANLSGLRVLTTCSPANFDLVKRLGADAAFDYHDAAKCAEEIRAAVGGGELKLIMDCIGHFGSPDICANVIAAGGMYASVSPAPLPRDDVKVGFAAGQLALGEPASFGEGPARKTMPADLEAFEAGTEFMKLAERLIREGKIKPPPVKVVNGLENIDKVLQELREWKVSATKYVCRVSAED